ncbi:hypothetical protein Tco_0365619 [Tanacetum coccineum]
MSKLLEYVRNISEEFSEYINCPSWNHPLFYFDDDEDDYIPLGDIIARYSTSKAITPDLPIEEPGNSLSMGDEHLNTIPETESDEVIKSSVENLVPIPSEFEGISDDTSDSDLEEFAGELAHIAPIPPGIVEADFDPNDGTSSDDDDFEDVEYEEVNDDDQVEKEFDLEDILQIQDVILREKLLKISRLISNIESLKDNLIPIEPDQEGLFSIDNSNEPLLEHPEFESFHFDPSFPRPLPELPDVEICLHFEPDAPVIDNFNELNEYQKGSEIIFSKILKMTIPSHLSFGLFSRFSPIPRPHLYLAPPGVKTPFLTPASSPFHFLI